MRMRTGPLIASEIWKSLDCAPDGPLRHLKRDPRSMRVLPPGGEVEPAHQHYDQAQTAVLAADSKGPESKIVSSALDGRGLFRNPTTAKRPGLLPRRAAGLSLAPVVVLIAGCCARLSFVMTFGAPYEKGLI